jgi:hypothetical protein
MACAWSGSRSALLRRRPLTTGLASHPSSDSSHSSAPWVGTEQLYRTCRNATASELVLPCRAERIRPTANFDVPHNRDRHCAEESESVHDATDTACRSKCPRSGSFCVEVSISRPSRSFSRVPTSRPLPEQLPNVRIDQGEARFRNRMAVIHDPPSDDRLSAWFSAACVALTLLRTISRTLSRSAFTLFIDGLVSNLPSYCPHANMM